jgi:hypothetical protein
MSSLGGGSNPSPLLESHQEHLTIATAICLSKAPIYLPREYRGLVKMFPTTSAHQASEFLAHQLEVRGFPT